MTAIYCGTPDGLLQMKAEIEFSKAYNDTGVAFCHSNSHGSHYTCYVDSYGYYGLNIFSRLEVQKSTNPESMCVIYLSGPNDRNMIGFYPNIPSFHKAIESERNGFMSFNITAENLSFLAGYVGPKLRANMCDDMAKNGQTNPGGFKYNEDSKDEWLIESDPLGKSIFLDYINQNSIERVVEVVQSTDEGCLACDSTRVSALKFYKSEDCGHFAPKFLGNGWVKDPYANVIYYGHVFHKEAIKKLAESTAPELMNSKHYRTFQSNADPEKMCF